VYRIRVMFHAPLDYVFRWCTDYRRDDGKRAGESFVRRVIERRQGEIILQDLWKSNGRWMLNENRTTLFPPNRWHVDSFGTTRVLSLDYTLRALPRGRTQLDIRARRRPTGMNPLRISRREYEANLSQLWRGFARSLDRDYRARSVRRRRG
jgi:hypothetical protein